MFPLHKDNLYHMFKILMQLNFLIMVVVKYTYAKTSEKIFNN